MPTAKNVTEAGSGTVAFITTSERSTAGGCPLGVPRERKVKI